MTNDKTDFRLRCPVCGYSMPCICISDGTGQLGPLREAKQSLIVDKGYCGLSPLETGEQDPYWRDGVCKQHDERFIKRNKSTWVVTRDFVTGATKTMLRGAWAVVGYPFYVLIGGIGGAIRYKFGGKK